MKQNTKKISTKKTQIKHFLLCPQDYTNISRHYETI